MITGHCECKRVIFEAEGHINDFSHCHCSQCRRLHGAAFASFAGLPRKGFRYVQGEDQIKRYMSSENHERVFCANCGSNIMVALSDYPDDFYVSLSAMNEPLELPGAYHIFVGSKVSWHEITDDAPQYKEFAPD